MSSDHHPPHEPRGWILLASFGTEAEARLVEGMLESAGIECSLESRLFQQEPVALGLLGQMRVLVRDCDLAAAQSLMAEAESGLDEEPSEAPLEPGRD
jgi:hypothetical protein